MARPQRCRKICHEPIYMEFTPKNIGIESEKKKFAENDNECIVLSVDEFEVIRLIDLEKYTHEECALFMEISRTTVTEIYENARNKIARSLVNGYDLKISGGNYRLCDGSGSCSMKKCYKKQICNLETKGEKTMRIAVTYDNGQIFQHFGHTEEFKVYDVENNEVVQTSIIGTNGSGHGALAGFLNELGADVLICGGIGGGAQIALSSIGVKLYAGISGGADAAVNAFLAGNLIQNANATCDHHDHEDGHDCGNHDHSCGEHSCGDHGCGNH